MPEEVKEETKDAKKKGPLGKLKDAILPDQASADLPAL